MRLRLPTVRSKLTALVATTVVLMVATLPVLSWLLHKQLIDEVDNRVEEAEKSFEQELRDDLDDLTLAARVITADSDTRRFLVAGDGQRADDLAEVFVSVYPDLDVLIATAGGDVLAQVGCKRAIGKLREVPAFAAALAGKGFRGLTDHGCEAGADAPPAYSIALPVKDGSVVVGAVVVCLPIDTNHLANASKKLGLELALVGPPPARTALDRTAHFPAANLAGLGLRSTLVEAGGRTFAMTRFEPPELSMEGGGLAVVAAMDVSDIQRLVRQHLFFALGVLGLATLDLGRVRHAARSHHVGRAQARERRAEEAGGAGVRPHPGGGDRRRDRGPGQRLQPHGRRLEGARQAALHLR